MTNPRLYADFQNLDDDNRLRLTCAGTRRDLERLGIELREGMTLTLYTDDANDEGQPDELLAEGVVHYDEDEKSWVAEIDWQAIRRASGEPGFNGGIMEKLLEGGIHAAENGPSANDLDETRK